MINAFNAWNKRLGKAYFVTVKPEKVFISAPDRPTMHSLLGNSFFNHLFTCQAGRFFELGNNFYKAHIYRSLIRSHIGPNVPIIPSDDEACWMASASCADRNPFIAILHADEEVYFQLVERYHKSISFFVCVSSRILEKLHLRFPQFISRSTVIPCGIFINEFEWNSSKQELITWVGRLSVYQKRAQDIIPLFKMVRLKFRQIHLMILGDGDFRTELQHQIETSELRDCVLAPGWVASSEIGKTLAVTRIFLQTSDFEGTSVAMMEALASGCIVVSTRVSGVEDLEKLPEAKGVVYLYDVGNIQEADELITRILTVPNPDIVSRARQIAADHFDIHKTNERLLHFVETEAHLSSQVVAFRIPRLSIFASPYLSIMRLAKWRFSRFLKQG